MAQFTLYFSFPSVFLPSGHFLCPLRFLSTFSLFLNDQHFKAATEQRQSVSSQATGSAEASLTLELIQSHLQVC